LLEILNEYVKEKKKNMKCPYQMLSREDLSALEKLPY
jgi:hypothetical protein